MGRLTLKLTNPSRGTKDNSGRSKASLKTNLVNAANWVKRLAWLIAVPMPSMESLKKLVPSLILLTDPRSKLTWNFLKPAAVNDMTTINSKALSDKRRLEGAIHTMHAEIDDMLSQAKGSEEKAK